MIVVTFDCDKCGKGEKRCGSIRLLKEIIDDYSYYVMEDGRVLCPNCRAAYCYIKKGLKEKYSLEIERELNEFIRERNHE